MSLWDHSLRELLDKGGVLMWPLLACSIVSVALVVDRSVVHWLLRLDFRRFTRDLKASLDRRSWDEARQLCERSRSPIARTAQAYLGQLEAGASLRETVVQREGALALEIAERRLRGLASIAQVATLLGLLGTVAGLVGAFRQIELHAGQVDPERLASGIWEALLTTVFGLAVAIPSFLAHHYFEAKVERTETRMSAIVSYLDEWIGAAIEAAKGAAVRPASERLGESRLDSADPARSSRPRPISGMGEPRTAR